MATVSQAGNSITITFNDDELAAVNLAAQKSNFADYREYLAIEVNGIALTTGRVLVWRSKAA